MILLFILSPAYVSYRAFEAVSNHDKVKDYIDVPGELVSSKIDMESTTNSDDRIVIKYYLSVNYNFELESKNILAPTYIVRG